MLIGQGEALFENTVKGEVHSEAIKPGIEEELDLSQTTIGLQIIGVLVGRNSKHCNCVITIHAQAPLVIHTCELGLCGMAYYALLRLMVLVIMQHISTFAYDTNEKVVMTLGKRSMHTPTISKYLSIA